MPKKPTSIPVNQMVDETGEGIAIERMSFTNEQLLGEGTGPHRHNGHAFFLVESGSISVEVDFQIHNITAPSVIYVHPDQVHRTIAAENVTICSWAIANENLHPEYLKILEDITPPKPITLEQETFDIISGSVSICLKYAERKSDKLYYSLMKDSCNALVALVISQYLAQAKPVDRLSRFEIVTKTFRELLERNYMTEKRPVAYAQKLNISTAYLNECVKNTTGYPVSHHVHQRVILEAKRLLFYSDKSVKEVAAELGYDDYPYFSRLFTKASGVTPLAFRNKNHE